MGRVFGTDGARGVANVQLTCELALKIGRAMAWVLAKSHERSDDRAKILIGMDTRASSAMLSCALAAGLNSAGADVCFAGVCPTPAVSYLVKTGGYSAGAMISASHNPCAYNGIKLFQHNGRKLPDRQEEEIECLLLEECPAPAWVTGGEVGGNTTLENPLETYLSFLASTARFTPRRPLRIALDCANGSAAVTAKSLFTNLGFGGDQLHILSAQPNGVNINKNCGSTDLTALQDYVRANALDAGFAFDGDADRLLAVDETGEPVDGDQILALCAAQRRRHGTLEKNTLVATVMSNMGLHVFAKAHGITVKTTDVGDRYVLEEMIDGGYCMGGEQSGHIIFSEFADAGDGQLTAIQVLGAMFESGQPLSALAAQMTIYPQVLINVPVDTFGKARCHTDTDIQAAVARTRSILGETGRVLLRVSGTEPLVRVMLEGENEAQITALAQDLAQVVRERLI
jgi:phosphoglucosamine mutase